MTDRKQNENVELYLPKQRIGKNKLTDKKWYIPSMDYKINEALSYNQDEARQELVNAANGIIPTNTLNYVLKPYGSSNDPVIKNIKLPGELRDTGLIKDILLKVLGRFSTMDFNYVVGVHNPDVIMKKNKFINDAVNKYLQQALINKLNEGGMDTGVPSKKQPPQEEFIQELKQKYFDDRARQGKDRLDALRYWMDDEIKYREAYFSWLVFGEYYSYRRVYGNQLLKEIPNTLECYPIVNNELFVEDYDGFLRKYTWSIDQVFDYFTDELDAADIKYLDGLKHDSATATPNALTVSYDILKDRLISDNAYYSSKYNDTQSDFVFSSMSGKIHIYHIVWPVQLKVGLLEYQGIRGIMEREVSSDYVLDRNNGDINIEWSYVNTFVQSWRIGDEATGIYLKPRFLESDRGMLNNSFKNKLPYGGKKGILTYDFNHSIVKRLMPFEILSRLYRLSIEREINKGLLNGAVMFIPKSVLQSDTISEKDNLMFMAADGRVIYDDTDPTKVQSVTQGAIKVVEPRTFSFIEMMMKLDEKNKMDAWDAIGWNRQVDGQTYASDGKGVTQQSIVQSSYAIAFVNEVFNKARQKDYEADLDYSKISDIFSEKGRSLGIFINPQGEIKELELDGLLHANSQYGLFVENSEKTKEKLDRLRAMALNMSQGNDARIAVAASNSDNPKEIEAKIYQLQDMIEARQAEMAQQEQANAQAIAQGTKEAQSMKDQAMLQNTQVKEEAETFRTILKINADQNGGEVNDGIIKQTMEQTKIALAMRKQSFMEQDAKDKNQINREKIKSAEKVAKMNKN